MVHTYSIWKEDEGSNFTLENAWRLLKNQPKRSDQIKETSSKRTKISTKGNYTPSSNLFLSFFSPNSFSFFFFNFFFCFTFHVSFFLCFLFLILYFFFSFYFRISFEFSPMKKKILSFEPSNLENSFF